MSGRKTKLAVDPKLTARVCTLLEEACSVRTACQATGLSESSFHRYTRLGDPESGDDHDPRFLQFWQRTTRARGEGKARLVNLVLKHAHTDGRLALEMLARLAPNEYGKRDEAEVSTTPATEMRVVVTVHAKETENGGPRAILPPYKIVDAPED